ncbi:MAG TPA: AI-2E family transporter [Acidimicrobiia bacterium]
MSERPELYERLRKVGVLSWSLVGVLVLLGIVSWLLVQFTIILIPLALAIGIVYLLNPFVDALVRGRFPRAVGTVIVYVVFIGALVLLGVLVFPAVRDQVASFIDQVPDIASDLTAEVVRLAEQFGVALDLPTIANIQEWLTDPANREQIIEALQRVSEAGLAVFELIGILLLAPILALYLLIDLPNILERARSIVPLDSRDEAVYVARALGRALGGFVRGQLVVATFVGIASSIGLRLIGHPFWLVIGLTAGILNLVPFVGPIVGGALAALTSLALQDFRTAVWSIVVMVIVQQIDNHLISPLVLRVTVKLSPVTIIMALIAGGAIGGLFGVLLAVPIVASVKVVLGHLWRTRILGETWEEATEAIIEEHAVPARLARVRRPAGGEGEQLRLQDPEDEDHSEESGGSDQP